MYTFRAAFYTSTLRRGKWEAYFDNVYVNVQRTELIVESFLRIVARSKDETFNNKSKLSIIFCDLKEEIISYRVFQLLRENIQDCLLKKKSFLLVNCMLGTAR